MDEIELWTGSVHQGDADEVLSKIPSESVDMCVTSPPYWGLRDYQMDGQIGLEEQIDGYVENLTNIFSELRRVLKPTGLFFLNIGDRYRDKELLRMPERVMLSLCDDGWVLRNKIVWHKPNATPHPVKSRFYSTYEPMYMFAKNKDYWFDLWPVRKAYQTDVTSKDGYSVVGKNPGDVWDVNVKGTPGDHQAPYPPELLERPIQAGCPPKVCKKCGTPYEREIDARKVDAGYTKEELDEWQDDTGILNPSRLGLDSKSDDDKVYRAKFLGWEKKCDCETDEIVSGIVIDPFMGSGTTGVVAKKNDRRWIGIDLNQDYVDFAEERIERGTDYMRKKERQKKKKEKVQEINHDITEWVDVE